MLEISPHTIAAFEASVELERVREFAIWWNARVTILSVGLTIDAARLKLIEATARVADFGIDANDFDRVQCQAVVMHLLPAPTGAQTLLAIDAIFEDADLDGRLSIIMSIARQAQR